MLYKIMWKRKAQNYGYHANRNKRRIALTIVQQRGQQEGHRYIEKVQHTINKTFLLHSGTYKLAEDKKKML